jgi:NAD(P)-dependent dehydrogenase (short-subunit alcohol dehydrogenase family)
MTDLITSSFGAASTARQVAAGVDLTGERAIVTGSASGIGVETAKALAEAGAEVTLAVRNLEAGAAIAARINANGRGQARVQRLDLSDQGSVAAFVDEWGGKPLHILIGNAGVMACPLDYTTDGLEMQIGTNHFGHYRLGVGMADALAAGAQGRGKTARLVSLSSIGHRRGGVNFDDPHYRHRPYDKWEAYGQAKTANALYAVGFNARMKDRGVTANAVHPGGIMTPLQRHLPREEMIAFGWMDEAGNVSDRFKSTEQGAATSVWAAVGPELEGVGGFYLEDCRQAAPWTAEAPFAGVMPHALDAAAADRLWALSADTTGADL